MSRRSLRCVRCGGIGCGGGGPCVMAGYVIVIVSVSGTSPFHPSTSATLAPKNPSAAEARSGAILHIGGRLTIQRPGRDPDHL